MPLKFKIMGLKNPPCSKNGSELCQTCHDGYFFFSSDPWMEFFCNLRECTCENGIGTNGTSCSFSDGGVKCGSCNDGFHLNGTVCEADD